MAVMKRMIGVEKVNMALGSARSFFLNQRSGVGSVCAVGVVGISFILIHF